MIHFEASIDDELDNNNTSTSNTTMAEVPTVLGFAAFGFAARCFQLGIQKRPIFAGPQAHVAISTIFGGLGYYVYHLEQRQNVLLAEKKKELKEKRERESATHAAAAA
ncbi:uncharacterized protein LOC62_04G005479 [Vanrija pseudolonga]|uniref:Uncharacterized protein n=1 Tax=Vanrija pseudolonga TaxID=143232 RepID=A0AAF1BRB9_9TREE|nr:hypothetical protein LOC62_04G005479 [Vanrija pseudolonga]